MPTTIEAVIDAAVAAKDARDKDRIEVSQAQAAVADELTKQTTLTTDAATVDVALDNLRTAAIAFQPGDDVRTLVALAQSLLEAEGKRVVDVQQLADAVGVRIKEQAEADAADADYDAAIENVKSVATSYVRE